MAITCTHLTSSYDNVDRTSYTTASVSPTASRWLVVDTFARFPDPGPTSPTVSGLSLSWTTELSVVSPPGAGLVRLGRYYAWTGASPGSGTITISYGAETEIGAGWIVYEIAGANTSDPFTQSASTTPGPNDVAITVTLASFGSANNRPLIVAFHAGNNEASTPDTTPSAYTEIGDVAGTSPNAGWAAAYNTTDTDTTPSYSWTTSSFCAAIASEIADVGSAGGTVLDPFGMSGFFGG